MIYPGSIGSDFQHWVDVYLFFRYTVNDLNHLFKPETMKVKTEEKYIQNYNENVYYIIFKNI